MLVLSDVCRTCNTENNSLVNIFEHRENKTFPSLVYMLEYCTQTTLADKLNYPHGICYNCIKQLQICYRFLKRFHLTQDELDEAMNYMQQEAAVDNCGLEIESVDETCTEHQQQQMNLVVPEVKLKKFVSNIKCKDVEEHPEELEQPSSKEVPDISKNITIPNHLSNLETPSQTVVCHICQKSYLTIKALNLHLKTSHKQKTFS